VETEKPKKLENLTEQDVQDWANWALEQANKITKEEKEVKAQEKLALKKAWKRYYAGYGAHPLRSGKIIP